MPIRNEKRGKPISPDEVEESCPPIPDTVYDCFNECIKKHYRKGQATFKQKTVAAMIASRTMMSKNQVMENGWLDVAPTYQQAGWIVEYDTSDEDEAMYTFAKKEG